MENNGQQNQWPFGNLVLPEGATVTVNNSVINGDQHNYYAPVYNSGEKIEEEEEVDFASLSPYIPDTKKASEYASSLRNCQSAKAAAFVVKDMYDNHIENDEVIVSKAFIEVIQGYLDCDGKSVNNIRENIKKIVLGKVI